MEAPDALEDSIRKTIADFLGIDLDQVQILGLTRRLADGGVARRLADDRVSVQFEVILPGEPIDAEVDSGSSSKSTQSIDNVVSRVGYLQTDATPFVGELSQALEENGVEVSEELSAEVKMPTVNKRTVSYTTSPWDVCDIPPGTLCMSDSEVFLRHREVWCADVEDLQTKLDDTFCRSLPTRPRKESCPPELSPPSCGWQTSDWSPCEALQENPCDNDTGQQKRSVSCLSADGNGDCRDNGPAPPDSQSCVLERDALDCQEMEATMDSGQDEAGPIAAIGIAVGGLVGLLAAGILGCRIRRRLKTPQVLPVQFSSSEDSDSQGPKNNDGDLPGEYVRGATGG